MGVLAAINTFISPAFAERAAILISLFFMGSPTVQMIQVCRSKGTSLKLVNPTTLILLFLNTALWTSYGVFFPMPPAVPGNLFGLFLGSGYLIICWTHIWVYQVAPPNWNKRTLVANIGALLGASSACMIAALSSKHAGMIGDIAMCICLCLFAAPLSVLSQVIKDRSSELLPPVQCLMQFMNCLFWVLVGLNQNARPIIVCNSVGLCLALIQLSLIAVFPSKPAGKKNEDSATELGV